MLKAKLGRYLTSLATSIAIHYFIHQLALILIKFANQPEIPTLALITETQRKEGAGEASFPGTKNFFPHTTGKHKIFTCE